MVAPNRQGQASSPLSGSTHSPDLDAYLAEILSTGRGHLERQVLPGFLARQRWFAGKGSAIESVSVTPFGALPGDPNRLVMVEAGAGADDEQRYFLPLAAVSGDEELQSGAPKAAYTLAHLGDGAGSAILVDACFDRRFIRDLLAAMRSGAELPADAGVLRFDATAGFRALALGEKVRSVGAEQSNVSVIVGGAAMLKLYRRLRSGEQPEIEVARFLTDVAGFANTPAYFGSAIYLPHEGEPMALAAIFAFVANRGDAWGYVLDALVRDLDRMAAPVPGAASQQASADPLNLPALLGRRTAELHAAFAAQTDDRNFAAEPVEAADLDRWVEAALQESSQALDRLQASRSGLPADAASVVADLLQARSAVRDRLESVRRLPPSGLKTRIHGDYHLGQVLVTQDDVMIIDFEGEPQRTVVERREKTSPLRDVAGMLRSFDYAAWSALERQRSGGGEVQESLRNAAFAWREAAVQAFLDAYWPRAAAAGMLPNDDESRRGFLDLFLLQKAFYEIGYEAANRPAWLPIPVRGVLDLLSSGRPSGERSA